MTPSNLKTIREALGMSQQQLADKLGYKFRSQINFMERSERPVTVTDKQLLKLVNHQMKKLAMIKENLLTS